MRVALGKAGDGDERAAGAVGLHRELCGDIAAGQVQRLRRRAGERQHAVRKILAGGDEAGQVDGVARHEAADGAAEPDGVAADQPGRAWVDRNGAEIDELRAEPGDGAGRAAGGEFDRADGGAADGVAAVDAAGKRRAGIDHHAVGIAGAQRHRAVMSVAADGGGGGDRAGIDDRAWPPDKPGRPYTRRSASLRAWLMNVPPRISCTPARCARIVPPVWLVTAKGGSSRPHPCHAN